MSKPHSDRRERPGVNLETAIVLWQFCAAVAAAIAHVKNRNVYGHTSDDTARSAVDGRAGRLGL
jgi:hypothetical protein